MADAITGGQWPIPKFRFRVTLEGEELSCQEVTGLKLSHEFVEYRPGDDMTLIKQKIPGLKKFDNITIKKAVFDADQRLYEWFMSVNETAMYSDDGGVRKEVIVSLLDEAGEPLMSWTIANALPISVDLPDFNSDSNELAVESIELAHEGIELAA